MSDYVDETFSYLKKRFFSFFAPLISATIISIIVYSVFNNWSAKTIICNTLFSLPDIFMEQMFGAFPMFAASGVSWYLSVLIMGIVLFYPFLLSRNKYLFLLAPFIALYLFGYLNQNYLNGLEEPGLWIGFTHKGVIRGIADLLLGITAYEIIQKCKEIKLTIFTKIVLTCLEVSSYCLVFIYFIFRRQGSTLDYYVVLLLFISSVITLSENSYLYNLFDNKSTKIFVNANLYIFLSHYCIAYNMHKFYGKTLSQTKFLFITFGLVLIASLFNFMLTKLLKKIGCYIKNKLLCC